MVDKDSQIIFIKDETIDHNIFDKGRFESMVQDDKLDEFRETFKAVIEEQWFQDYIEAKFEELKDKDNG